MPELLGAVESPTHDAVSAEEMALSSTREAEGKCESWKALFFVFYVHDINDPALIQGLASIRGNTVHV